MNLKWIGKVAGAGAVMFGTVSAGVLDEPYGICSHVSRRDWDFPFARQEFALMNRTGIRWVRSDYDWARVEPQPGKWDFSHLDQLQAEADRAGIHILPILAYDVKWATPAWKHPDAWGEYVRRLVTRYGKKLRCWEVWNEQNSVGFWKDAVNGENYVKLLRRTWQEIKKIDPELQVVYGGTAGVPFEFIGETLRAGAANWFDAMNIHPYHRNGTPENLIPQLKELRALMTQYGAGNKPIWISEVGWSTAETPTIHQAAIPAALQRAGIDAGRTAAAVIDDPENGFSNTAKFSVGRDFPMFREIVKVKLAELKGLDIRRTPVLLVLGESFPAAQIDDLIDFVRRGGTLLCANGLPFYLELNPDGRGNMVTTPVGSRYMKKFHLGWETWWVDETVPPFDQGGGAGGGVPFRRGAAPGRAAFSERRQPPARRRVHPGGAGGERELPGHGGRTLPDEQRSQGEHHRLYSIDRVPDFGGASGGASAPYLPHRTGARCPTDFLVQSARPGAGTDGAGRSLRNCPP